MHVILVSFVLQTVITVIAVKSVLVVMGVTQR